MILVDSSVWIDDFRGVATPQADRLDALLGAEPIAIGDLIARPSSRVPAARRETPPPAPSPGPYATAVTTSA